MPPATAAASKRHISNSATLTEAEKPNATALLLSITRSTLEEARRKASGEASLIGSPFVAGGSAGVALFLLEAAAALQQEELAEAAVDLLDSAIARLPEIESGVGLFTGLAGIGSVAWLASGDPISAHWRRGAQVCEELDRVLLESVSETGEWIPFDLLDGVAGVLLYALERYDTPSGQALAESCIRRLELTSASTRGGVAWVVPRHTLNSLALATFPEGTYPLGTAHGIAGVIAALARTVAVAPNLPGCKELLERALRTLIGWKLPSTTDGFFPRLGTDDGPVGTRADASWCWGDPGIAAVLFSAGRITDDEYVRCLGLEAATQMTQVRPFAGPLADGCLCHGWAGIAHIMRWFHHQTSEERFAEATRAWLRALLGCGRKPDGVGGLYFRDVRPNQELYMRPDVSLLSGSSGVGLALLAMTAETPSRWDRMLAIGGLPDS